MPEVELPADFIAMRDAARVRALNEVCPALEGSEADSETAESETTNLSAATNSTAHSDGLLVEDAIIDQILETTVQTVQASLSSVSINQGPSNGSDNTDANSGATDSPVDTKRADELAGLKAAITNAINRGSCSADKISIVEKAKNQPPPEPESPPDAPRDPRDRRKRIRSGCFRYVSRSDVPNSMSSLISELKLIFDDEAFGLKLSQIFTALDGHPDKPLADTWSGVSVIYVKHIPNKTNILKCNL